MKISPLPWTTDDKDPADIFRYVLDFDGWPVCRIDVAHQFGEANAALICAAPDMLEALKNLENDDGRIPAPLWKLVTDAIAKAEGHR